MGHCSSYDTVQLIDTALANEVSAKAEIDGVVVPSNISQGPLYSLLLTIVTLMKIQWMASKQLMQLFLLCIKMGTSEMLLHDVRMQTIRRGKSHYHRAKLVQWCMSLVHMESVQMFQRY